MAIRRYVPDTRSRLERIRMARSRTFSRRPEPDAAPPADGEAIPPPPADDHEATGDGRR